MLLAECVELYDIRISHFSFEFCIILILCYFKIRVSEYKCSSYCNIVLDYSSITILQLSSTF